MPDLALDLRFLRYAILVAEHGSFRRAADAMNLSQSTVSRRIQLLERRVGVPLFERSRSGVRPTPAGERFIREAAFGAEHIRQAVSSLSMEKRGQIGELKIVLMASLASGFLADVLEAFHFRFPNIDIKIEEATAQATAAGVLSGRLDAAFIPGEPRLPGCQAMHLWGEPLYVAVSKHHSMAARVGVNWEDLRDETFLVAADVHGPEVEAIIVRQLSGLGFHPRISVQRVGRENLLNMVGMGFGVTLAATSTQGASYPAVIFVPLAEGGEVFNSSVVWSTNNVNPALKRLLDLSASIAKTHQRRSSTVLEAIQRLT
ncbi:LysR family transcriptional regulator [Blastomonas natatoria]|uniref:LysR family transcriptional regulator n=1 Tax=Blastomonas natatoria TaxID=34015 RepID=A0A2V3UNJ3_9SPHN|nr:LysR family transcriptional regulator [Blastomonas natatoria]PXW67422.1 LysR family transcriptional regulator [Blastomonas natatoria]